jgi:hypothetical protein
MSNICIGPGGSHWAGCHSWFYDWKEKMTNIADADGKSVPSHTD